MEEARPGAPAAELSALLRPADLAREIARLGADPKTCPVCAGERFERLFRRSGKWFWSCRSCALVFVHDIYPEFVEDTGHLEHSYVFDRLEDAGPRKRAKYAAFLARLHALGASAPGASKTEPLRNGMRQGKRLLEVGCGQGLFLEAARAASWEVQGVEVLPQVAERARERGLDVFTGELAAARFPAESFDAVVLREVIEHIVDPVALLGEARRVLRPGGAAVLGTGNARSWAARWRGGRWAYYRFGGHMHIRFYSPSTAHALARAAGFARATSHTSGFAFLEAEELRGRWYKPLCKLAQLPLSPLATALGAGQRLVMFLHKG